MSGRAGQTQLGGSGDGAATNGGASAGGESPRESGRAPILSMILMAVFLVGGSVGLVADWPAGPGNLDWGVWVVLYGGYAYVIGAAILHARTGR